MQVYKNKSCRYVVKVVLTNLASIKLIDFLRLERTTLCQLQGWLPAVTFWPEWVLMPVKIMTLKILCLGVRYSIWHYTGFYVMVARDSCISIVLPTNQWGQMGFPSFCGAAFP